MQKNPFDVLGVNDTVTQNELYEAYKKARDKYVNKRYAPGEEGARACEKLDEIEAAYKDADQQLQKRYYISKFNSSYKNVEDLIKDGKIDEAQSELDKETIRDAEWHFLQSMIYFRKRWYNEAREQVKAAMEIDPGNSKYREAYENLNAKMDSEQQARKSFYNTHDEGGRSYRNTNADRAPGCGVSPCDCCSSLICADCCCECMGGDLISCC